MRSRLSVMWLADARAGLRVLDALDQLRWTRWFRYHTTLRGPTTRREWCFHSFVGASALCVTGETFARDREAAPVRQPEGIVPTVGSQ